MAGPSGCGLCGIESIEQLSRDIKPVSSDESNLQVPSEAALNSRACGTSSFAKYIAADRGAHAAAWCSPDGEILALREDVGRHNALDKILGWRALNPSEVLSL